MFVKIGTYPTHRWYHNYLYKLGIKIEPKVSVRIDDFDTWGMDETLAYIILPMLKQLKATKHGAPNVDPKDVPVKLRPTKKEINLYTKNGDTDDNFFPRWDWVLDEMIFAFENKHNDWEEQFHSGVHDKRTIDREDGSVEWVKGPNDTFEVDWKGHTAYQERITQGFKLFGKYYEALWD